MSENKQSKVSKESGEHGEVSDKKTIVISGATSGAVTEDLLTSIRGDLDAVIGKKVVEFREIEGFKGQYGSFSIEENGHWVYTLRNSSNAVQSLAAGEVVTERFLVVTEEGGANQYVTITVTGTNDVATISGLATGALTEDATMTASGVLTVSDVDHGEAFMQVITGQAGTYGSFSIDANGNWTYLLNNAATNVQALAAGEVVTETFVVTSLDGTATQPVTLTITGTNDAPVITSGVQAGAVVEDGVLTASGQITSSDVDNGATATYTGNAIGAYGSFAIDAASGAWTYVLDNAAHQNLAAGEVHTESFTATVTDDQGATATQLVTLTITGTNDAPVITSGVQAGAVQEDVTLTTIGQITSSDVDNGATATYTGNAIGAYGSFAIDAASGAWTYVLDNAAHQNLAAGEVHTESFTATVTDDQGATATQLVTLTITGTNDAPVITSGVQAGAVQEDVTLTTSGQITSSDVDNGATATYTGNAIGAYGSFAIDAASGAWTYVLDNAAHQNLAAGEVHTESFTATVTDDQGATATQLVTLTITGTNDAPVITNASAAAAGAVIEDASLVISGQLSASDVDNGATQSWSVQGSAAGVYGDIAVDAASGLWTYSLNNAAANVQALAAGETHTESFVVRVTDDHGAVADQTVSVLVTGTNDAPVINEGLSTVTGSITAPATVNAGAVMTATAAGYLTAGHNLTNGLGGAQGFGEQNVAVGDDNSTGAINIQSVFGNAGVNFFGANYTSLYINNNGNITFGSPSGQFTPNAINAGANNPIIAPFWGDVDTRGGAAGVTAGGTSTGSNLVHYDLDAVNKVVTITWNDVGYYAAATNALNAFQVQLIGTGNGNFDIVFRYENINWTAGSASGGSGGLGGTAARAGFSAGDGINYYELPQSGFQDALLALPTTAGNTGIQGVDVFHVLNGQVISSELTQTGAISFNDVDLTDVHSVQSITYTGVGSAIGYLSLVKVHDTTGTGTGGEFDWTYHVNPSAIPHAGQIETFDVVIADGRGGTTTQQISVELTGANAAPVFDAGVAAALPVGTEDTTYVISSAELLSGWSDADADNLSVQHLSADNGVVVDNLDGTFSITPMANFNGVLTLSYAVSDGRVSVDATRSVTVLAVNDVATITGSAGGAVTEDVTLAVSGALTVSDVDIGQAHTQVIANQAGAYGSFSVDANGNWSYSLDNASASVQGLTEGQIATETFAVSSLDGTAIQHVTVDVTGTNDVAVFSGVSAGTVVEDATLQTTGALQVSDADFGQSFIQAVSNQAGQYGSFGIDASGNWTYNLDNGAANVQALTQGQSVQDSFTVHSLDGSAAQQITVDVIGSNEAPTLVAGAPSATLIEQGGAVAGMANSVVSLVKADVDGIVSYDTTGWTQLSASTFQKIGTYGSAVLDTAADTLSYTLDNANAATNALNTGTTVTDTFNVSVVDAFGATATAPAAFLIQGTTDGHGTNVVYMTGSSDPWGVAATNAGSPDAAMNLAFGAGLWQKIQGFSGAALTQDTGFLYIDGGDGVSTEFNAFINSNRTQLENFVSTGGHLVINAARWDQATLDLGFGATLSSGFSSVGNAVNPAANQSLFNGPVGNAGTQWTGNYFSHDVVTGVGLNALITGTAGVSLADEHFGSGYVMLGGITSPYFQQPQAQADILRADMLYYASHII